MSVNKLGISTIGFGLSVEEQLPLIAEVGFEAFFTGWGPDSDLKGWKKLGESLGLEYDEVHSPFGRVNEIWTATERGMQSLQTMIDCLHATADAEIPTMVVHPFTGNKHVEDLSVGLELYGRLIREAEGSGVQLAFENLEWFVYFKAIMDNFGHIPEVKFCWDNGHEHCYSPEIDYMSMYGDKLVCTHFHDNFGNTNPEVIHWIDDIHILPFDGNEDFHVVMDKIRKSGFTGPLVFELGAGHHQGTNIRDVYSTMGAEGFLREAYKRAVRVRES